MTNKPTFEDLVERARNGTDEDWDFIEVHLKPDFITPQSHLWAGEVGLVDHDDNVRDFAATVLAVSNDPFNEATQRELAMHAASDNYPPVRYWSANALYKRGVRTVSVVKEWKEACEQDNPAGVFARKMV